MNHKISLSGGARLLFRVCAVSVFLLFTVGSRVNAQYYRNTGQSDSDFGISIGADYDAPVGNLSYTFKPTFNYNLSVLRHYDNFTMNLTLGYHSYKAKQDTFYYQVSATDYGTVTYQPFTAYSLYLGLAYDLPVNDQLKVYGGINLGAYYVHFAFHSSDLVLNDNENFYEQELYFAPKVGFTYMLSDNIGVGIEGKYNFFAPTGKKIDNDRVGTLYNSYAAGVRLTYNF